MGGFLMLEWIIPIVLVLIVIFFIVVYNGLIVKRNRVKNAWSQIDVQLKKRANLVPNLVETVKGYAKHEKTVFENVTKARTAAISAGDNVQKKAQAENMLSGALKSLFAVAEAYPELKANENFKLLQEQLDGIESKIAYARQFFNDSVLAYNNAMQTFPNNVIAGMFGFKEKEFFEIAEAEKKVPKVSF
ncbi:LemA family protein [Candidatus Micrarchaeota archaeon]|nr:LemA family protein [Candidatus Micrarchaeota archaeon]MBU2476498.1 LemA family protein [Candidatus Micrarchaeota archaeon]